MIKSFYILLLSFLLLYGSPVVAQQAAEPMGKPSSLDAFSTANLLNMFMGLAIVVALILGLAWVLKKYGRLPANNLVNMKVIGGLSLGTREKALLIEVENTRLLVGVTPGHIQTLYVLDGKQASAESFNKTLHQQLEQADD